MNVIECIKKEATRLGFDACGFAKAESVSVMESTFFKYWLTQKFHGEMKYMERYQEIRLDPCFLLENARTILMVALNYNPLILQKESTSIRFAKYAYGKDYHYVIKNKLKNLLLFINSKITNAEGRIFTDSAPVLEKYWAWKAGLGFYGKNTQLILPRKGSYFFLGGMALDIELEPDIPIVAHCGTCTQCLDNCPTHALVAAYTLNSTKCISYQTIENHQEIPIEIKKKIQGCAYGCDRCQEVCPHNRFATPTKTVEFFPLEQFLMMNDLDWIQLDHSTYNKLFKGSSVQRAGFRKLKKNIQDIYTYEADI